MDEKKEKRAWNRETDDFVRLAEEQGVDLTGLILDGSGTPENEVELLRVANELDVYVPTDVLVSLMFGSELWNCREALACAVAVYNGWNASKASVEYVLKNVEWHAYNGCFSTEDIFERIYHDVWNKLFNDGYYMPEDVTDRRAIERFHDRWCVWDADLWEQECGEEFHGVVIVKRWHGRR